MKHCAMILGYQNVRLSYMAVDSVLQNADVDIILVEAAARPGDMAQLKQKYANNPHVILLPQTENKYCAWGMNQGIKEALRLQYDSITLMNNDATVDAGYFDAVEKLLVQDEIGIVQPKTMFGNTDIIYSLGVIRNWVGFPILKGFGERDTGKYDGFTEYASMVVCTIKSQVFREIGLLDEDYIMYLDDIDFSIRALKAGWVISLEDKAVARHHVLGAVGQTSSKMKNWVRQLTERNLLLMAKKNGYLTLPYVLADWLHCLKTCVCLPDEAIGVIKGQLWFWRHYFD